MRADIRVLLELAGVDIDSPQARRLIEAQELEKVKQPTDEEDKEEETEEEESLVDSSEEDEEQPSITITAASVPTAPVSVGAKQMVTDTPDNPAIATAAPAVQPQATAPTTQSSGEVVKMFFEMRDQIHFYHLQTQSFAEHKALNDFYETILDIADKFMEAYQGVYGRATGNISLTLKTYTEDGATVDTKVFAEKVKTLQKSVETNTDLVNLLDELLNACNKTVYLLTLK